jgi:hypothetical protein
LIFFYDTGYPLEKIPPGFNPSLKKAMSPARNYKTRYVEQNGRSGMGDMQLILRGLMLLSLVLMAQTAFCEAQ